LSRFRSKATGLFVSVVLIAAQVLAAHQAAAQERRLAIVRDAEIEHIIRTYATPILAAAGLDPEAVSIHLINDRSLNAFVAGGQRIFFHTGLLVRAETPGQVMGVLAHEIGHIAGGHIARGEEAIRDAFVSSLIATLLGAAAIAAGATAGGGSGGPNAGIGVIAAGQQIAQRNFLAFTRTQESAADQAAVGFLDGIGQSSRGLVEFLSILGEQDQIAAARQDPYVRTHPLSRERVDALVRRVDGSPFVGRAVPPEYVEMHQRTQAKLIGFLDPLPATLKRYPVSDASLPARYARAIAYYRVSDLNRALPEIDGLIAERPSDPYFHELKGQMLLENGRIEESIPAYRDAVQFAPREPLLLTALGQAYTATEDNRLMPQAIQYLEESIRLDDQQPLAWYHLSIAYGRVGRLGEAHVASAERALLTGRPLEARQQAERGKTRLNPGTPAAIRADDIIAIASRRLQEQRNQGR